MPVPSHQRRDTSFLGRFAEKITRLSGTTGVFVGAVAVVLGWAVLGPVFQYSET